MNILKLELKAGRKQFILWIIGLFFLVFAGITKFTGLKSGGSQISDMIDQFPRPLQAMLGLVGVNISKIDGYYAIIVFYVMVCISIYAITLGANAIGREAIDKTYEFVFTKPRSRSYILAMKLVSGLIYLVAFGFLNYLLSAGAIAVLKLDANIASEILLFSLSVVVVGLVFYSMSIMIVSFIRQSEKGLLYSNIYFVIMFIIGMLYDVLENAEVLRIFTPMRYFVPSEIMNNHLNVWYLGLSLLLCISFTILAFVNFEKKDLQASN